MRRIAVQNLKGGTAKTTTSVNLAHGLAMRGKKVLLLDADVQGNVAACLGLKRPETGLYQLLIDDLTIPNCVVPSGRENLDVLPSDRTLAVAEVQLQGMPRREEILSLRLRSLSGYDYVIVDCGPTLSLLHQNVLLFAEELLIPISTEYLAMLGAQQILESMKFLRRYFDRAPRLIGVVPTLFDARTNIGTEIAQAIQETYRGICPVPPAIPLDTRVSQSMAKKKNVVAIHRLQPLDLETLMDRYLNEMTHVVARRASLKLSFLWCIDELFGELARADAAQRIED